MLQNPDPSKKRRNANEHNLGVQVISLIADEFSFIFGTEIVFVDLYIFDTDKVLTVSKQRFFFAVFLLLASFPIREFIAQSGNVCTLIFIGTNYTRRMSDSTHMHTHTQYGLWYIGYRMCIDRYSMKFN